MWCTNLLCLWRRIRLGRHLATTESAEEEEDFATPRGNEVNARQTRVTLIN